jgi:hypothetical protein
MARESLIYPFNQSTNKLILQQVPWASDDSVRKATHFGSHHSYRDGSYSHLLHHCSLRMVDGGPVDRSLLSTPHTRKSYRTATWLRLYLATLPSTLTHRKVLLKSWKKGRWSGHSPPQLECPCLCFMVSFPSFAFSLFLVLLQTCRLFYLSCSPSTLVNLFLLFCQATLSK